MPAVIEIDIPGRCWCGLSILVLEDRGITMGVTGYAHSIAIDSSFMLLIHRRGDSGTTVSTRKRGKLRVVAVSIIITYLDSMYIVTLYSYTGQESGRVIIWWSIGFD